MGALQPSSLLTVPRHSITVVQAELIVQVWTVVGSPLY
jgi:hypothetical protein